MLDAYIIDQIKRKEEAECERRREQDRPRLELPLVPSFDSEEQAPEAPADRNRGVVVIDLLGSG